MKNQRKKKRILFVGSVFAVSLLALIFVILNFRDNIVFFYSPSEMFSEEVFAKIQNQKIRVGGLVVEKSVKKIDAMTIRFAISDLKKELKISYSGIVPDLFRDKQGVVAEGFYDAKKEVFVARQLLIKHDEKYMPPEVERSLK